MAEQTLSNTHLLRLMVMKEVRTTFRERSQMLGLAVSVLMLLVVVTASLLPAIRGFRVNRQTIPGLIVPKHAAPLQHNEPPPKLIRWVAVGLAASVGFFFSCGYLFAAVLATFVGEKEARTLEILLASPLTDAKLYLVKCISVLLPSAALGFSFSAGVLLLLLLLLPAGTVHQPAAVLSSGLLLGFPITILVQTWFVGLGAAISARTDTMKGAGQILGVMLLLLIFGSIYCIPLLLVMAPSLGSPMARFEQHWLRLAFAAQYAIVLAVVMIPAIIFVGIGKLAFRRDRMLV